MTNRNKRVIHHDATKLDGYNTAIDNVLHYLRKSNSVCELTDYILKEQRKAWFFIEAYDNDIFGKDDAKWYRAYESMLRLLLSNYTFADLTIRFDLIDADYIMDIGTVTDIVTSCWKH